MPFKGHFPLFSHHLAVELFRGRIRVSYDVGNYPVSTMFSYELVSDDRPHRVEILAVGKNFTLRVDGGQARSIINEGQRDFLETHSPMYIAGVPADVGEKALNQWHIRNVTSFRGEEISFLDLKCFTFPVFIPALRAW